jgi:hypothetical protein
MRSPSQQFRTWLQTAKRGDQTIYHTGYLSHDRGDTEHPDRRTSAQVLIDNLGAAVKEAERLGLVLLTQKRLGENHYAYYARKRTR